MSETVLIVVPAAKRREAATELLEAAEILGLPARVVESQSEGYRVPLELAEALPGAATAEEIVEQELAAAEQAAELAAELAAAERAAADEQERLAAEAEGEPQAEVNVEAPVADARTTVSATKGKAKG